MAVALLFVGGFTLTDVCTSIAHKVLSHDVNVARVIRQLAKEHVPRGFLQV